MIADNAMYGLYIGIVSQAPLWGTPVGEQAAGNSSCALLLPPSYI
jgi:hypothetical protein